MELTQPEKEPILAYSNIIASARQPFTTTQHRIIKAVIYRARETGMGFEKGQPLTFRVQDYIDIYGLTEKTGGRLYLEVREACRKLRQSCYYTRYIDEDRRVREREVNWLSQLEWIDQAGEVHIAFNPEIKNELYRLTEDFTQYNLKKIAGLRTMYANRLYELMAQYRNAGHRFMTMDELRFALNAPPNMVMRDFNAKILKKSVEAINSTTDLKISVQSKRRLRAILGFHFTIKENQTHARRKRKAQASVATEVLNLALLGQGASTA